MPFKLLIVDPDPAMRHPISNPGGFISTDWDQKLYPGVLDALNGYAADGWHIHAITNQGGIGSKKMSWEMGEACQAYLMKMAPCIQSVVYCPDMDGKECWIKLATGDLAPLHTVEKFQSLNFRQPAKGMIEVLRSMYVPDEILCLGSRDEDERAAGKAKVPYMKVDAWLRAWQAANPVAGVVA